MNKLKVLIPSLMILIMLLTAVSAQADEAEDLTPGLNVKTVDNGGRVKRITDGDYTTYWESNKRERPYVILSSDKPVYGLYLCFRTMPDSYVIQKETADGWTTVAEGDTRFYHAYYELNGMTKIRILSTADRKNKLAITELFCFGEGNVPDWVQRWEPTEEKADIMFVVAHPDDELIFLGGAIPYYALELNCRTVVAYLTPANYPARRSEALNGLWTMGIHTYPVFGPFSDHYAKTGKLQDAYKETTGGKQAVWEWMSELFRKYRPEVVVTHDPDGEYGHPQHKMVADSATVCYDQAADPDKYPDSAKAYGIWQVKKLYLHLYGDEKTQTVFDWMQPLDSFGGKTGNELAEEAFQKHVSQYGKSAKIRGKRIEFTVEEFGVKRYPNNRFGLCRTEVGTDENRNDFLEHIDIPTVSAIAETGPENVLEKTTEEGKPAGTEEDGEEPAEEELTEAEEPEEESGETAEDTVTETLPEEPAEQTETAGSRFRDTAAPAWADVTLNTDGFLDDGEYVFADDENGRYIYVNRTLRIVIERTYEEPDPKHPFYCFTANIWCDVAAGELPVTVFNNPEKPKSGKEFMRNIAMNNKAVFAATTDYYIYRIKQSYPTGIEIRNGEVIFDDPHKLEYSWGSMPTYETLALYSDGHADSLPNKEKSAEDYVKEGATQVYTFGPCLVKDGQLTEYAKTLCNESYNPRLAIGVAEDGHYIVMMCEGRVKRSKGVRMAYLAELMLKQGCTLAVNMDGGQSAVIAFMGHQLNKVVSSDPNGREQADILTFGTSDQVGTFEMADEFKTKRK